MAPRKLLPVCASTDKAAWDVMWKSVWPVLHRQCTYLMCGDADMAGDLAVEVALSLCGRYTRGELSCRNLIGYACGLARLRALRAKETAARHGRQLERFRIHIAKRSGYKVITDHSFMYDDEKNENTEK